MTMLEESSSMKERVLILCTGNSARSQMAEGLLRHEAGVRFEVQSAGTKPSQVRPEAITVMKELGIDISGHRSKHVDEFKGQAFDYVLTVCNNANESCPYFPAEQSVFTRRLKTRQLFKAQRANAWPCFVECAMKLGLKNFPS
jgi:protein-tyrosine-phosphatase